MDKQIVSHIEVSLRDNRVQSSHLKCINKTLTSSVEIVLAHLGRILLHWVVSASKEALVCLCLYSLDDRVKQKP